MAVTGRDEGGMEWRGCRRGRSGQAGCGFGGRGSGCADQQEVKTVTPAWDWAPSAGLRGAVGSTQRGPSGPGPVGRQRRRCVSGGRGPSGGLGSSPPRRGEVLQEPRAALWAEEAVNAGGTAQERGRPWPSGERTSRGRERPPGSRAATRPRETRAGSGPVALCKEVWGGRDCSLSGRWP